MTLLNSIFMYMRDLPDDPHKNQLPNDVMTFFDVTLML